jgi:hypothetical protein
MDESPHYATEVGMSPPRGQLVNALPHKEVIGCLIEPNEWFCFSEAATSGIIYPKTLALMRDFEYYYIEEASSGTHRYPVVQ